MIENYLKTPYNMNKSEQANPLTTNEIENIQKEHEALMKRNQETLDFWKRYGYKK